VQDLRRIILEAGLAILREQGLAGLTQPRIAARTGLRQSHLTYYYPTRADLVAAVARLAIETQLAAVKSLLQGVSTAQEGAEKIAGVVVRHESTRVFAALNQAADQEAGVRAVFGELLEGFIAEIKEFLGKLGLEPTEARIDLVHALFVGLSIIDLATGRPHGKTRAKAVLDLTFQLLSQGTDG